MIDTLEWNKALVVRLYEEGFNQGNLDVVDEIVAPDVVTHDPIILDAPTGPDSIRRGIEMIRKAFPDFHVEVLDLIAESDRVASYLLMRGTNTGDYRRGGATNKKGTMRAFLLWRVADGRLVAGAWPTASSSSRSSASFPPTTSSPRGHPSRGASRAAPTPEAGPIPRRAAVRRAPPAPDGRRTEPDAA